MRKLILFGLATTTAAAAAAVGARAWWKTWGIDAADIDRPLPGDDIVPEPTFADTRTILIDASPRAVWPWLVQMGFGRAGWYSWDALDLKGSSASEIVPEWQSLAIGDLVRTHPQGGFAVRALEPEHALVLYFDTALVSEQAADLDEQTPAGLKASGAFLDTALPTRFAASWAFVLEPEGEGRTRFIERFRVALDPSTSTAVTSRVAGPLLEFGMFVMIQKQMTGIRDRAEGLAHGEGEILAQPAPA